MPDTARGRRRKFGGLAAFPHAFPGRVRRPARRRLRGDLPQSNSRLGGGPASYSLWGLVGDMGRRRESTRGGGRGETRGGPPAPVARLRVSYLTPMDNLHWSDDRRNRDDVARSPRRRRSRFLDRTVL